MSATDEKVQAAPPPLSLRQLTEVLIKHYGLSEGQFDLLVNYQIGGGAFGPTPDQAGPGVAVSVAQVGLAPAVVTGHLTVDASTVGKRKKKTPVE